MLPHFEGYRCSHKPTAPSRSQYLPHPKGSSSCTTQNNTNLCRLFHIILKMPLHLFSVHVLLKQILNMYHNRTFHPPPSYRYKYRVPKIAKCCMKILFYTQRESVLLSPVTKYYSILSSFLAMHLSHSSKAHL